MPQYKGYTVTRSDREGKKYKAVDEQGRETHFGSDEYRIKPGTEAGDNYCTRSAGIASHKGTPNWWARQLWSCEGKKSVSDKPFFGLIDLP